MGLLIKLCIVFQLIVKETESAVSLNLDTSGTGGYELRFGKSVRLNCTLTGSTCCPEARRWLIRSGGTFSSIINDGVSTDASKYEEDLQEASNQFNLIIKNFDIADVNLEYQCQYQFSTNEYTIQMSDGLIYIPTTNDINVISSDFQMTTFSYSVNITSVYPQPNCSCIYDGDDLTAQMTTTVGDNGVLKYAVLNLSNIAHTCSGEFRITCSIGSYNDQQIATTTPCPETTTEEPPSTTEQSTLGSSIISTASSHSTTIGSGQKLSTQLIPMSDVSQSSQLTSTEGEITSISTRSNLNGETETFSSKFPIETETSSFFFQGLSLNHVSNTYIAVSLIHTLTSNIIHVTGTFSLYFSSTKDFSGYRSESLFRSSFFNYHSISISTESGLTITANLLNSLSGTMNVIESSNLNYAQTTCCNDSNSLSSTHGDRSSFLTNTASVIVLKSLSSLSESLPQELQSTPAKSVYHTLVTQNGTISTLDYTPLNSLTNTNNIRLSTKPSNESGFVSSDDLNSYSKYVSSYTKSFFNDTLSYKFNVGATSSEINVKNHSKMGSFETRRIEEFTTYVKSIDKRYLSSYTAVDNSMETTHISESLTMKSSPENLTTFQVSSDVTKSIPVVDYSSDTDSSYESYMYEIIQSIQVQNSIETVDISASAPSIISDASTLLHVYTSISKRESIKFLTTFPVHTFDSTDVYRKRSPIQTSLLTSIDVKAYISATKVMSTSFFDESLRAASYVQSESLLFFPSAMMPSEPQQSSMHHIRMSSLNFTTSGNIVTTVSPGVPSLNTKSKVIAISASAAGCVLFVTITVIILFSLKILPGQKQKKSKKVDTFKEAKSHSVYERGLNETSFNWPSHPVRYYSKNGSTWDISNDNRFSSRYNENWDLI